MDDQQKINSSNLGQNVPYLVASVETCREMSQLLDDFEMDLGKAANTQRMKDSDVFRYDVSFIDYSRRSGRQAFSYGRSGEISILSDYMLPPGQVLLVADKVTEFTLDEFIKFKEDR